MDFLCLKNKNGQHTNLKIAYKTTNTIKHHLKVRNETTYTAKVDYTNYNVVNVHLNISDKQEEHLNSVTKNV
jgi:hypothetical protein